MCGKVSDMAKKERDDLPIAVVWLYGDIFLLEQMATNLDKSLGNRMTDSYLHMINDHLLVDDLPGKISDERLEDLRRLVDEAIGYYEQGEVMKYRQTLSKLDGLATSMIMRGTSNG